MDQHNDGNGWTTRGTEEPLQPNRKQQRGQLVDEPDEEMGEVDQLNISLEEKLLEEQAREKKKNKAEYARNYRAKKKNKEKIDAELESEQTCSDLKDQTSSIDLNLAKKKSKRAEENKIYQAKQKRLKKESSCTGIGSGLDLHVRVAEKKKNKAKYDRNYKAKKKAAIPKAQEGIGREKGEASPEIISHRKNLARIRSQKYRDRKGANDLLLRVGGINNSEIAGQGPFLTNKNHCSQIAVKMEESFAYVNVKQEVMEDNDVHVSLNMTDEGEDEINPLEMCAVKQENREDVISQTVGAEGASTQFQLGQQRTATSTYKSNPSISSERNLGVKRKMNNDSFLHSNSAVNGLDKMEGEDELTAFGRSIVAQIRKLPELDVLDLIEQIQTLVTNKRREHLCVNLKDSV